MNINIKQNIIKVDFFVMIFIGCLLFLAAIKIPVRFDANTFIVTSERVLAGDISKIYDPINGSGPFTYAPWVSFLMVPFSLLGKEFNLVAAFSSLSILGIFWTALKSRDVDNVYKVQALFVVCTIFSFLIWESLYIGQIDIILCFLIFISYASRLPKFIKYLIIAIVVSVKPQFFPLLLLRKSAREVFFNIAVFLALASFGMLVLYLAVSQDARAVLTLLDKFVSTANSIASTIDVTNQSALSIMKRFFESGSYSGRYYPAFFSPSSNVDYTYTQPYFLILCSLLMVIIGTLFFKNFKNVVTSNWAYSSFFLVLPIFSPLFWFVHYVYIIPVSYYLLNLFFAKGKWYLTLIFLPLLASTPVITTNYISDVMLANGLPLVSVVLLLLAYVYSTIDKNAENLG